MNSDYQLDKIYEWLNSLKSNHKVTYNRMAEIVGYSGPGIAKAIRKKTLSIEDIKKIAKETGYLDSFNKLFETNSNPKPYSIEDQIAERVAKEVSVKYEKQFSYLKEQLGEITEKLNELLVHREIDLEQEKNKNRKLTDS